MSVDPVKSGLPDPRFRVAVIGAGSRSANHILAYTAIPEARVVAVADRTGSRSPAVAARFGLRAYQDVGRMLREEHPDLVHVVTGPRGRVDLMEQIADAGVPLATVEKPVALDVADYRRLERLLGWAPTRFAVSHQFFWHPDYERVRNSMSLVGPLRWIDMSAGMSISGQGTHILHYGMGMNGGSSVTRVFGAASGWDEDDRDHPGPLATMAQLEFANGVRGAWSTGRVAPRVGTWPTVWQHVRVAAYGESGWAHWEEFGRYGVWAGDLGFHGAFDSMDAWRDNNLRAQAGFHRAMLHWGSHPTDAPSTELGRSLHEWKVVLALYASALIREPVALAAFDPDDDLVQDIERVLRAKAYLR